MDYDPRLRRRVRPLPTLDRRDEDAVDGAAHPLQDRLGNAGVQRLAAAGAQAKLEVGAADDSLEREADAVADAIMGGQVAQPARATEAPAVQRAGGDHAFAADDDIGARIEGARGGDRLPDGVRSTMEAKTGAQLDDVRVHDDAEAHQLAGSVGAHAFTHGKDIHFARGAYDPGSRAGQHLLAHELTHVVQQAGGQRDGVQRMAISAAPGSVQRKGLFSLFAPLKQLFGKKKKKPLPDRVEPTAVETQEPERRIEDTPGSAEDGENWTISNLGKNGEYKQEEEEENATISDLDWNGGQKQGDQGGGVDFDESGEDAHVRIRRSAYTAVGVLYDLLDRQHADHHNYWGVKQVLQLLWDQLDDGFDDREYGAIVADIEDHASAILGGLLDQGQATIGPATYRAELQIGNGKLTGFNRMVEVARLLRGGDLTSANALMSRNDDWKTTFLHDRPMVGQMVEQTADRIAKSKEQPETAFAEQLARLDRELQQTLENGGNGESAYQQACEQLKAITDQLLKLTASVADEHDEHDVDGGGTSALVA
jgi:hypothetical protein